MVQKTSRFSFFRDARLAVVVTVAAATLCGRTFAAQEVRVGAYDYNPLVFRDRGTPQGMFIDIIEDAAAKNGWKITYVYGTWEQNVDWLKAGKLDLVLAMSQSRERASVYDLNQEAVVSTWVQLYVGRDRKIDTVLDLEGTRVAGLRGDLHCRLFMDSLRAFGVHAQYVEKDTAREVFELVSQGKADALVCERFAGLAYEKEFPLERSPLMNFPSTLGFATTKGRNRELLEAIDNYIKAAKPDPASRFNQTIQRWFGGEQVQWRVPQYLLWTLGGSAGLLLLFVGTSLLFKRQVRQKTIELRRQNETLQTEIIERKRAEGELARHRDHLEELVAERTATLQAEIAERKRMEVEVEKTHKHLMLASRQAGMAEVATSVLHNVGNVLNSVNVSATLVSEQLKQSRASSITRLAALMREQASDLAGFIKHDPRGQQLPNYISQLAEHLETEQRSALKELNSLGKNIEHIKEIVAMQQEYAKVSGVTEIIKVAEMVEDALRMSSGALERHQIQVVRELDPSLPEIIADKHKVLQILVNLIRNAKYACDESNRHDKVITVRAQTAGRGVRIQIIDNGVGIPPENLTRIFGHGFTTRKHGHGFGLHSGALAAKEFGGALLAHSDGPDKGATFTLELPMESSRPSD